jgi:hypothetical protein
MIKLNLNKYLQILGRLTSINRSISFSDNQVAAHKNRLAFRNHAVPIQKPVTLVTSKAVAVAKV